MAVNSSTGNAFAAGYTSGALPGQTAAGGDDAFVRHYDSSGNTVWTSQFGTPSDDRAWGVAASMGYPFAFGDTSGVFPGQPSRGVPDVFLRKFNVAGLDIFTAQFGADTVDFAAGAAADSSGNVYMVGSTAGVLGAANLGDEDMFVRKVDAFGAPAWTQQVGGSGLDFAGGIAVDGSGNVMVIDKIN